LINISHENSVEKLKRLNDRAFTYDSVRIGLKYDDSINDKNALNPSYRRDDGFLNLGATRNLLNEHPSLSRIGQEEAFVLC
jgi:hypothetical protein